MGGKKKNSTLYVQRESIKYKLNSFVSFIQNLKDSLNTNVSLTDVQIAELSLRIEKTNELYSKFDNTQDEIEACTENLTDELRIREELENEFCSIISNAKVLLENSTKTEIERSDTSVQNAGEFVKSGSVKLPTINLPKFSGNYNQWLEFRDTFVTVVHNNNTIDDVLKFQYLKSSLLGDAAKVIQFLETSRNSYSVAWKLMCDRYDKKRMLVNNHMKALFNMKSLDKESAVGIRSIISEATQHLRALEILEQPVQQWDAIIIFLVTSKLDSITVREWECQIKDNEIPERESLFKFLTEKADTLESIGSSNNKGFKQSNSHEKQRTGDHFNRKSYDSSNKVLLSTSSGKCACCDGDHIVGLCKEFNQLSVNERKELVKSKSLCLNCLRSGHYIRECKASFCKKCNRKHNTLLHTDSPKPETPSQLVNDAPENNGEQPKVLLNMQQVRESTHILLATVLVDVIDAGGNIQVGRALLDSGSQSNLVTTEFCKKLGVTTTAVKIALSGIGQVTSSINAKCQVTIKSRSQNYTKNISCYVTKHICGQMPHVRIKTALIQIPNHVKLADPKFNVPNNIDILLGANIFWELLESNQMKLGNSLPILQQTKLGWIVTGPTPRVSNTMYCNFVELKDHDLESTVDIQQQLAKFWVIEECSSEPVRSQEEKDCETHYLENTTRDRSGRFVVAIPFKESIDKLGDSKEKALNQFYSLERKLERNPQLKQLYDEFMLEYINLGHMTKTSSNDNLVSYYMPHHGVFREDHVTTKLRVVFNASAVTTSGVSLNNLQMNGPTIQNDLLAILIRFREYTYVVCADISKMYRQVLVRSDQRQLQKILWRFTPDDEIKEYCLNTVTYGTTAAPFLAIRSLYQLALDYANDNTDASNVIKHDFYVDDLLTGGDNKDDLAKKCIEVSNILKTGWFELRKWKTNEPEIIRDLTVEQNDSKVKLGQDEKSKTLGIYWSCKDDTLTYQINVNCANVSLTKRIMLSTISQIFDPLGLLSACTIIAKITLQNLWLQKLTWDEPVPELVRTKWLKFVSELGKLNEVQIPRHVSYKDYEKKEIHVFVDASKEAYGACIYTRSVNSNTGNIISNLLCAKSKVAPLKPISTPRLELCAALLGARFLDKVLDSSNVKYDKCILWSDSTIVLAWVKTSPNLLKSFVCNRVAEIQSLTKNHSWRYVPSKENAADILSRGISPSLIVKCEQWWHGPKWLSEEESYWPIKDMHADIKIPESKNQPEVLVCIEKPKNILFDQFSKFNRMKRVLTYCLRFKHNCLAKKLGNTRKTGILTNEEIQSTLEQIIRVVQRETFTIEYENFLIGDDIPRNSKLLSLNPFLDSKKLIRVGGRLNASSFKYDKKFPIVLPGSHLFTKLLFEYEHNRLLHAGPQQLLYSIRESYWPLSGKNVAREVVRKCVVCFKVKPKSLAPLMGNLPAGRISQMHPFGVCGVDYGGPFVLKDRKGRGSKQYKAYISLFVCFITKAIHIELVTDLTTESFIAAFRRFVSRRGQPVEVNSDNGTNFVGANNELNDLANFIADNQTSLEEHFNSNGIKWKFIPPHSPHMGGLWEAGIRSAKHHIKRVTSNALLTYEEFVTLLNQAEAVLNSRPLTQLSTDPTDPSPLTPSHFLVGRPLTSLPDPELTHIHETKLSVYQKIQQLNQHFWSRWAKEYISELQTRTRWKTRSKDVTLNTIVILKEDNTPPGSWMLGTITALHPGDDGVTRVVTVKTRKGLKRRALTKLCPLPIDNGEK